MIEHRARRLWWAPWVRHCVCGARTWPCGGAITERLRAKVWRRPGHAHG
jgi:hypothetical protein